MGIYGAQINKAGTLLTKDLGKMLELRKATSNVLRLRRKSALKWGFFCVLAPADGSCEGVLVVFPHSHEWWVRTPSLTSVNMVMGPGDDLDFLPLTEPPKGKKKKPPAFALPWMNTHEALYHGAGLLRRLWVSWSLTFRANAGPPRRSGDLVWTLGERWAHWKNLRFSTWALNTGREKGVNDLVF